MWNNSPPPFIIPIFIQNQGCPSVCVFCNQFKTASQQKPPKKYDAKQIQETVELWLTRRNQRNLHRTCEVAFYGGSFTGLPLKTQNVLLCSISEYIQKGQIDSVRISTRPDSLTQENISLLKKHNVQTIELGVQSLDNTVLQASGRGHLAQHSIDSCALLKKNGFAVGIQLMPGLPEDTFDKTAQTTRTVITLQPDFIRIYPTVVVKGTKLASLFNQGRYSPLSLEEGISRCAYMLLLFKKSGIPVIRTGLQAVESLQLGQNILAGPYHPAFGQLVISFLKHKVLKKIVQSTEFEKKDSRIRVPVSDLSNFIGQKRENVRKIKQEFGIELKVEPLKSLKNDEICIWFGSSWKTIETGSNFITEDTTCW